MDEKDSQKKAAASDELRGENRVPKPRRASEIKEGSNSGSSVTEGTGPIDLGFSQNFDKIVSASLDDLDAKPSSIKYHKQRLIDAFGQSFDFANDSLLEILNHQCVSAFTPKWGNIQFAAFEVLRLSGQADASLVVPGLCRLLEKTDHKTKLAITFVLESFGAAAEPACPTLYQLVHPRSDGGEFSTIRADELARAARRAIGIILFGHIIDIKFFEFKTFDEFIANLVRQGLLEPNEKNLRKQVGEASLSIVSMLATLPKDAEYEDTATRLSELGHEFRQAVAERLQPSLNAKIHAMPNETYEQKKELARWVNDQLEPLGLAVQEPKTGLPGKLRAQTGNWPEVGRFAIEIKVGGKQKTPTVSDALPELTLTDSTPQQISEVDWRKVVGPKETRPGRRR